MHVEGILKRLTGVEAATAVNNNAAAVLLCLNTLARGKEVIVSRGELVEIGGSFRVPDVMERSGAKLREVGTTNKTHLKDYEKAITENTGLLLKVHTSNYKIVGFTKEVSPAELALLGKKYNIPVMWDLGSGSFIDLATYGAGGEPTVQQAVDSGVDVLTFSGDKLLGGPQAGMILGRTAYLDPIRSNPLARALRIDKLTLAALDATLRQYLDRDKAAREIPTLWMLTQPLAEIRRKAELLSSGLGRINDPGLSSPGAGRHVAERRRRPAPGQFPDQDRLHPPRPSERQPDRIPAAPRQTAHHHPDQGRQGPLRSADAERR